MTEKKARTGRYSFGARLAMTILGVAVIALGSFAWRSLSAGGNEKIITTKIGITGKTLEDVAEGLTAYHNIHKSFMPYMNTKKGPELDTLNWGKTNPGPIAQHLPFDLTDPFSNDGSPIRYWGDSNGWTIWSIGPDGDYDLTDPAVYAAPGQQAIQDIGKYLYNFSNGPKSSGDIIMIYRPAESQ